MTDLIKLAYVGKKPSAHDNIARSGKTWNGHGDVQEVTLEQARRLLRHPDQWALVDPADQKALDRPVVLTAPDDDGKLVKVDPAALKLPLERMSRPELRALAMKRWGKTFANATTTKTMIDQINEWENDIDMIPGVE